MKIHFIAIGGSVMHQLAISLQLMGYNVTGSDDEIFEPAKTNLAHAGIMPRELGWNPDRINSDIDEIILGMHARADNPELIKAREIGLPIYSFPEYIYNQSLKKIRVAVGGSHGKTTTTSMIMHVMKKLGKEFDYMVGARLQDFDQSVRITNAPVIICEADEYPASAIEKRPKFHFLFPHIAVITGIAWDHINVFPTYDFYKEQFTIFINKIESGCLIFNNTDKVLKDLIEIDKRSDLAYIPYDLPVHSIIEGQTQISIEGYESEIAVFGNHNLLNLNAAFLVCRELGIKPAEFVNSISDFTGAAKRLELMYKAPGFNIYRDFAHAPSKVKASIEAVKRQFPDRKLFIVLELHTYSSLNADFMVEYNGSLDPADECVVFYSAHALALKKMPFLSPDKVLQGFNKKGLEVINDKEILKKWLEERQFDQANLLLMSSGTYDGLDILQAVNKVNI